MHAYYIPKPPLSCFVKSLWLFEWSIEDAAPLHTKERLLPDGSTAVVFSLREEPYNVYGKRGAECHTFHGGSILGPQTDYFILDTSSQEAVIGIQFKPACAFPFFDLPLSELHNAHFSAREVWGAAADDLVGDLIHVKTPVRRFQLLEQFLLTRLNPAATRHPAVLFALHQFSLPVVTPVREMADLAGLSSRRFIEVFRRETGLTPKLYQRVRRFQSMLQHILYGDRNGADAALEHGYFDQAHCIHEFQEFSGLSPLAYARASPRSLNHVPLPDSNS